MNTKPANNERYSLTRSAILGAKTFVNDCERDNAEGRRYDFNLSIIKEKIEKIEKHFLLEE